MPQYLYATRPLSSTELAELDAVYGKVSGPAPSRELLIGSHFWHFCQQMSGLCPQSRGLSLFLTKMEEAFYWLRRAPEWNGPANDTPPTPAKEGP
jgi:hypothetical protein